MLFRFIQQIFLLSLLILPTRSQDLQMDQELFNQAARVSASAWEMREAQIAMWSAKGDARDLESKIAIHQKHSISLANLVVDNELLVQFSDLYKKMDQVNRDNFDMSIRSLVAALFVDGDANASILEYFPGWGESKPGYIYRRGKELRRIILHSYWKDEEITESTVTEKEYNIEVSLIGKLQAQIPGLIVGAEVKLNIDGKLVIARKVKFSHSVTIVTKQRSRYANEEVWYELFEALKPWPWQDPDWKLVGQTFLHDNRPTGLNVIVNAGLSH